MCSNKNIETWLAKNAPGYADLSEDVRSALSDFFLTWTIFEGWRLDCHANPNRLKEFAKTNKEQLKKRINASSIP